MKRAAIQTILYLTILVVCMGFVALIAVFITLNTQDPTTVPDIVGQDITNGILALQERDLIPRIRITHSNEPEGTIIRQSPSPGGNVRTGKDITLTVSRGRAVFLIASFIGQDIETANLAIQELETKHEASIQLASVMYVTSSQPYGTILEQSPLPNSEVGTFTQLDLVVSAGDEQQGEGIVVPDLRNAHFESATETLLRKNIHFRFFLDESTTDARHAYRISRQSPGAGSLLTNGQLALNVTPPATIEFGFAFGIYEYVPQLDVTNNPDTIFVVRAITSEDQQRILAEYYSIPPIISIPYLLPEDSIIELVSENGIVDTAIVE